MSAWKVIGWWELRRLPYNALLLVLGLLTIFIVEWIGSNYVRPGEDVEEPLGIMIGAVLYAALANACYTLGWIVEILGTRGGSLPNFSLRKTLFWGGIIFSAALTLVPAFMLPLFWAVFGFQQGPP